MTIDLSAVRAAMASGNYENAVKLAIVLYETEIAPRVAMDPKDPVISEGLAFLVDAPEPVRREFLASFGIRTGVILALLRPEQRARLPKPNVELHEAVRKTKPKVVAALLAAGADPTVRDGDDREPLQLAIQHPEQDPAGQLAIVKMLLDAGASPNAQSLPLNDTTLPLTHAVTAGDEQIVELLLARGADPNLRDGGATVLEWSLSCVDDVIERYRNDAADRRENYTDDDLEDIRRRMARITKLLQDAGARSR